MFSDAAAAGGLWNRGSALHPSRHREFFRQMHRPGIGKKLDLCDDLPGAKIQPTRQRPVLPRCER
jgi:hypothetical protein